MADVTATGNITTVNVSATTNTISVTDTLSNIAVSNISSQTVNVAVTSNETSVNVTPLAVIANSSIRPAISVTTTGGSLGSLSYNVFTGVINLNGPFASDVRQSLSNTSPVTFNQSTGVIGIDSSSLFTGKTTDDLAEGSTNLYFTNSRARSAISATSPLSYDSATGVMSITEVGDISEVVAGAGLTGGGASGVVTLDAVGGYGITVNADDIEVTNSEIQAQANVAFGLNTTDNLPEGSSNFYFTSAKANSEIVDFFVGNNDTGGKQYNGGLPHVTAEGLRFYAENTGGSDIGAMQPVCVVGTSSTSPYVPLIELANASVASRMPAVGITMQSISAGSRGNVSFSGVFNVGGHMGAVSSFMSGGDRIYVAEGGGTTLTAPGPNAIVQAIGICLVNQGTDRRVRIGETINLDSSDKLQEGSTNLYFTPSRFNTNFSGKSTSDLSEGTNLYYTDARSRSAISVSGSLTYNPTLGIISYTNFNSDFDTRLGTKTTDNLSEGSTNLYFTNARADARVDTYINSNNSAEFNQVKVHNLVIKDGPAGSDVYKFGANSASNNQFLVYDGTQFKPTTPTTSIVNEGTNLYYTTARQNTDFDTRLATKTTSDLAEGTNLYYTDARVEAYLSGNTSTINANTIQANAFIGGTFTGDGSDLTDVRAESMEVTLKNADTVTIPKGYPVHATGFSGSGEVEVVLADAGNAELMPAHFIAQEELTSVGDTGRGILGGRIQNVDTSSFTVGDTIFVAVGGGYANVAPTTEANLIQNLGIVTRIDASNGGGEIMGAGRTAATPNLDDGALFVGSSTNQAVAVNSTTNFDVSDTEFDLANALTNVNSIQSESANDKFSFKALLGADNTPTLSGNITSDGYEVIINSGHTYASSGNISQQGSNNLNGYAVSGVFTAGSNVMTLTGVTELKNVYAGAGNITGANNNVSLTGDMVAGMIPDQYYTASVGAEGGEQYPLPQGTTLVSANTTALVFSESALANVTAANATNAAQGPFAIMHGGKDATTGQIISFLSQDDAVSDGTQVESIDDGAFGGIIALIETETSPVSPETNDSITIGLPGTPSIPVGTAVTFANVTGTGASNINGQTLYIKRSVFDPDNFNYTLTTDAAGTTTATMTAFGLVSFDTGGGDITYSVAQSTSTISKARLYVEDTYGYPATGPTENDFTYTIGSASDYTIDLSAATTSFRGRTSLEAPKQVLKAPIGLTIGENTTMSNRGDGDALTNFGLNFVWDGLTDYSTLYAGTTSNIVPQMLFKSYTDNTFASGASGKGRGGPRLFFAPSTGNINTSEFDKYPRKSQELGRMTFWGPTQTLGDSMSTVNPPGFISATAQSDWTTSNKLDMHFAANGDGYNNADIFLTYTNGKVVIGSATDGSSHQAIHFAPAVTTTNGNAAQQYATLGHTWANVNYANVSASTGSKLTINQGGADGTSSGDVTFSMDRDYIAGTNRQAIEAPENAGLGDLQGVTGETPVGNQINDQLVITKVGGASLGFSVGEQISFENVTGPGNANINGGTFYAGASVGGFTTSVWTSSDGTTTPANAIALGINPVTFSGPGFTQIDGTGSGNVTNTVTGTSARDYTFNLPTGSENLVLSTNGTTHSTFYSNGNLDVAGNLVVGAYKLPTADGTLDQVIKTDGNGVLSFGTVSGSGTVTSVGSGNGLTGGPITGSGSLAVGAGAGITVNSTNVAINYGANQPFTANVDAANVIISDSVYVDNIKPYTGGGTLTFTSPRMTDVKIGNIFYPDGAVSDYNVLVGYANATGSFESISTPIENTNIKLKQFGETVVALGNQSGNIAAVAGFNAANASIFSLTATGGITISQIPNVVEGGSYTIKVTQDGTGSHALTSTFKFAGGDKTLSTAGGSIDVINIVYDGTDYLATLSKAYA